MAAPPLPEGAVHGTVSVLVVTVMVPIVGTPSVLCASTRPAHTMTPSAASPTSSAGHFTAR